MSIYKEAIYPAIARLSKSDAEVAHERTLQILSLAERHPFIRKFVEQVYKFEDPCLKVEAMGLHLDNPLGLAAGFDKNVDVPNALAALGFGHIEVGTVTPEPQPGNSRPRIFRLRDESAIINRMGFPGPGVNAVKENLERAGEIQAILGVNVGANKTSVDQGVADKDYVGVIRDLARYADYLVVNVSSPNTAQLRDLQGKEALGELLGCIRVGMEDSGIERPLLVKIAPDFENMEREVGEILEVVGEHGIDGIIATNTTISREGVMSPLGQEAGGLSGTPLRDRSTEVIKFIYKETGGRMPIIGVGGVFNANDVVEKMEAGASLVQVYTGLVYEGPGIVKEINRSLARFTEKEGISSISVIVGADS